MSDMVKQFQNIEEEFFELDHKNKKALIKLSFDKPSDVFDVNAITKTPVFSDDFLSWIGSSFQYAPRKYKIDLDISFVDMENYTGEQLLEIFRKNIFLEVKKQMSTTIVKNNIAIGLIVIGLGLLVSMIFILNFWKNGGVAKEIVSYVFDIATTVTLWEALTILIVENKEKRDQEKNLAKRFDSIRFHKR